MGERYDDLLLISLAEILIRPYIGDMMISGTFLVGVTLAIFIAIIMHGIDEIRAEKRWMKRYQERKKMQDWEEKLRQDNHL